ncbi:Hpt domain-containing protein [Arthrobacter sp. NPDC057013]
MTLGPTPAALRMEAIMIDTSLPAYDPLALMSLAHEAGEAVARRFLDHYLELLPHRHARTLQTLTCGDAEEAMDAVLSLKVASAIVGAAQLSAFGQNLQDQLKSGSVDNITDIATELDSLVAAFNGAVPRL